MSAVILPFRSRSATEQAPVTTTAMPPRELSKRQWMERKCLQRAAEARDADAKRIWMNHADWIAMTIRTSPVYLPPIDERADEGAAIYDARRKQRRLGLVLLALLAFAALLTRIPPFWA